MSVLAQASLALRACSSWLFLHGCFIAAVFVPTAGEADLGAVTVFAAVVFAVFDLAGVLTFEAGTMASTGAWVIGDRGEIICSAWDDAGGAMEMGGGTLLAAPGVAMIVSVHAPSKGRRVQATPSSSSGMVVASITFCDDSRSSSRSPLLFRRALVSETTRYPGAVTGVPAVIVMNLPAASHSSSARSVAVAARSSIVSSIHSGPAAGWDMASFRVMTRGMGE